MVIVNPYSEGRLRLVASLLVKVLGQPCSEREMLAYTGHLPPAGSVGAGWRPWPWVMPRVCAELNAIFGPGGRLGQPSRAAWRMAEAGVLELATSTLKGCRARIRFCRIKPDAPGCCPTCGAALAFHPAPAPVEGRG